MGWLLKLAGGVTGNPMLLVWIAAGSLALGVATGGGLAWKVQGWRLDAVQARFDGFLAKTKTEGEKAALAALAIQKANERRKEQADNENAVTLAALRADNRRLFDVRARGSFLPAAPAAAVRPDRIAFDRAEIESAIRLFDSEVSGIVGKGDEARVNLDTARKWAQDPASGLKVATAL